MNAMSSAFNSKHNGGRDWWTVAGDHRRGVLLLVVVSMLTLFLMLGTTYLVVAARAKQAARVQARLAMDSSFMGIAPARLLDSVLLKVVRGGPGGVSAPSYLSLPSGCNVSFESLLADKYGNPSAIGGTATTISTIANSPLLGGTIAISGIQAADLPGRVLTILGSNREPTSHRILSGTGTGGVFSVVLDNPARHSAFILPSLPVDIRINGLEFDGTVVSGTVVNESYDAFDDRNPFLSHVAPKDNANAPGSETVAGSIVKKIGYFTSGTNPALVTLSGSTSSGGLAIGADNDNDGSPDGIFLDFGLPSVPSPFGAGTIDFHASVLVVDLDSRFNVNAHGSLAGVTYPSGCPGWPSKSAPTPDAPTLDDTPMGSGYGPPEVNGAWLFPKSTYPSEASRRMRGPGDSPPSKANDEDEKADGKPFSPDRVEPTPYFLSGAHETAQKAKSRPQSTRFTPNQPLVQMPNFEGKYGQGIPVAGSTKFVSNCTDFPKAQTSGSWTKMAQNTFPLAVPGSPNVNDTLSLIRDRNLAPANSGSVTGGSLGLPPLWWSGSSGFDWTPTSGTAPRAVYNSPPDLHGRMLTTTAAATQLVPRLVFAKAEWDTGESTDDPYELRLDPKAARTGSPVTDGSIWDSVFGFGELEAVLRPYDRDAQQLTRRLVQVLGPAGEEARLRITTDSWDTTAITGSAATTIRDWLKTVPPAKLAGTSAISGIASNELSRGERLNLNRPLSPNNPGGYDPSSLYYVQRQSLFKDLFILLVALGKPANATTAQWAANVVEFQDADSTMTPFEYDTTPANGWDIDNDVRTNDGSDRAVVWGAERPEILIRDAIAWLNTAVSGTPSGIALSLHRPWNAKAVSRVSGTNIEVDAEPCDYNLDTRDVTSAQPLNQVNLGMKPARVYDDVSPERLPIWRIRITNDSQTQYIRFDSGSAAPGATNEFVIDPPITGDANKPKLGVDDTLTIVTKTMIETGSASPPGIATILPPTHSVRVPGPKIASVSPCTVYLERLSDLSLPLTLSGSAPGKLVSTGSNAKGRDVWDALPTDIGNPNDTAVAARYLVVDKCVITPADTKTNSTTVAPFVRSSASGSTAFWASQTSGTTFDVAAGTVITLPMSIAGSNAAWFVWPNRPLVSSAELHLVPGGSSETILTNYKKQTAGANDLLSLNVPLLLETAHVPTRFSGIHTTIINASGTAALGGNGLFPETTPVNQISSYREPGRVNLNTIASDDVWNAVVAGPLANSGTAAPVKSRSLANFASTPATTLVHALALSGTGTSIFADTHSDLAAIQGRNPLHEIYTATRLANTATIRSNVFAIWITVRESVSGNPDTVKLHRGFYIVDRSIPVAHDPGKDHNVWDCVVLRRIIE